jgi:predicted CXXCH cytochrome family protein
MMKKYLVLVVAMLLVASVAYAGTIVGSKHDMRGYVSGEGTTQVCVFCHVPHNGNTTTGGPLWNHTDTGSTFGVYTSATLNGTTSQPAGISRACLSCHDGTVAVNSLLTAPKDGSAGTLISISGAALLGTDLSNDHPVSITYRDDQDSGLRAKTSSQVVGPSWTAQLFGSTPYTVECASCHAVHDPTVTPFLRVANTNSQMCTTCHLK